MSPELWDMLILGAIAIILALVAGFTDREHQPPDNDDEPIIIDEDDLE